MKRPPNTTQVKDISELKQGMEVYIEYISGKAKKLTIENKKTPQEQADYRRFWKYSIEMGVVYY